MRVTPILFALAWASLLTWLEYPAPAWGQSRPSDVGEQATPDADHRDGPEERPVIVVVVEGAGGSLSPDAIRDALGARLPDTVIAGVGAAAGRLRARALVAIHADGSVLLDVALAGGHAGAARLPAAPAPPPRTRGAARGESANGIAEAIAALVLATEGSASGVTETRHGLLPWEYDTLRRPNAGITRIDGAPLLPWPGPGAEANAASATLQVESAAGLTAPPPPAQNR